MWENLELSFLGIFLGKIPCMQNVSKTTKPLFIPDKKISGTEDREGVSINHRVTYSIKYCMAFFPQEKTRRFCCKFCLKVSTRKLHGFSSQNKIFTNEVLEITNLVSAAVSIC